MFLKRLSGYQVIKLSVALLWFTTFFSTAFAQEAPRFYGEEVVVTAAKYIQPRLKSPWNVSVITEKEIRLTNAKTIGEVIQQVSGGDIRAMGDVGSLSTAGLRIIGADKTLVLIDGRKINSPLNGNADLNDILLDNIERIEIIKSPVSALYGSEAVGGVINVITKKGKEPINYDLTYSLGSFGTNQYKATLLGKGGFLVADAIRSNGFRENSDYTATKFGGNYGWNFLKNTDLNFSAIFYDAHKGIPNVPSADAWSASKPKDRQDDQNIQLDLISKAEFQNLELSARIFRNSGDQTIRGFNLSGTIETQTLNKYVQTGVEIKNLRKLEKADFLSGVEYREDYGNSTGSGIHTLNNLAAYLQLEFEPLGKESNLTIGVRGDKHSMAGTGINPRLGLLFPIGEGLYLRANCGQGFRAPTINELFWTAPYENGNPNLVSEKSKTYELGIRKVFGSSLFQLTYHRSDYTDIIYWGTDPATWILSPKNIASAKIEGLEFEVEYRLSKILSGFANYTYQKSTGEDPTNTVTVTGEDLIYMPRNKYNVGLRLDGNEWGSGFLYLRYVGERNYIDFPPPTYVATEKQLPSFLVVDVKAIKAIGNFNFSLGVDNLLNESYSEAVGFSSVPPPKPAIGYPAPARRITFGVEYKS